VTPPLFFAVTWAVEWGGETGGIKKINTLAIFP
jgi:hypothetical protein